MPSEPEPAYRLAVAPRFAIDPAWPERLRCCDGVVVDAGTGEARPRGDWAAVSASTLPALVDREAGGASALPPTHLGLVQLPERLRRAWWTRAEQADGGREGTVEPALADIAEFFRFKGLPLPEHTILEVVVSAPGLRSTGHRQGNDARTGLGFGERAPGPDVPGRLPAGVVNLGDEESFVALLTLPAQTLAMRLIAAGIAGADTFAPQTLATRYLATFPGEPVLRVRLEPGEGLWLSPFGVVHDGWTEGKTDVDVILRVG